MASKKSDDHAGSGLDKPPPKTIAEKIRDAVEPLLGSKDKGKPAPPLPNSAKAEELPKE